MKGKIKVIVITLVLLLVATGVFLWKMNDISKGLSEAEKQRLVEERDLLEEQKGKAIDDVNAVNMIPLHLSGEDKNVVSTKFKNTKEIYSVKKSQETEENLTTIKKNKSFSLKDPLWAYNPYGTNGCSMYVYFTTSGKSYCRYTISVKDEAIPDFTRTAAINTAGGVTKEHEYQIIGLVPGETNYITLSLYNPDDELSEKQTFSIDIPSSRSGARKKLKVVDGRSRTEIANGLYVVFQKAETVKKKVAAGRGKKAKKKVVKRKKNAVLLYDNSGILRTEIPTNNSCGRNMEQIYGTLLVASGESQLSQINPLGQVIKTISLSGYKQAGEYTYDGSGNVYLIATAAGKKEAPASRVIEVVLETGGVTEMVNMNTLFKKVYQDAVKKSGKKNVNWVELNSVMVQGTNTLLLSSKKLSSIIKVSNVGSFLPKVNYIIADKRLYKKYDSLRKKVLTKLSEEEEAEAEETPAVKNILKKPKKKDPFPSQYGQEAVQYRKKSAEGQYELTMLNCNAGKGSKNDGQSYYLRYLVDETANTYQLKGRKGFDRTKQYGNIQKQDNGYVYCISDRGIYIETDDTGKLIKQYYAPGKPYRVVKNDFKGFWFQ